jgi:N12 class adenine-specific DNA methylase
MFGEVVSSLELAPEGNGYRFRSRFAKFNNLPELMALFKNVADIQTADMLNLPVPKLKDGKYTLLHQSLRNLPGGNQTLRGKVGTYPERRN